MSERFVQYIVFIIWKLVDHVLLYKNFECFSVCHAGDFIQSMLFGDGCLLVDLKKIRIILLYLSWNLWF